MSVTPNLPAIINPLIRELPTITLHWWSAHFEVLVNAAKTFDECYGPSRAYMTLLDELQTRNPSSPTGDDLGVWDDRLFDDLGGMSPAAWTDTLDHQRAQDDRMDCCSCGWIHRPSEPHPAQCPECLWPVDTEMLTTVSEQHAARCTYSPENNMTDEEF